jgi:Zn-dependent metalloprotease
MTKSNKKGAKCSSTCTCFIIPPYVHEEIAVKGSGKERERALHVLELSERLRGIREVTGSLPAMFISAGGQKRRTIFDALNEQDFPGSKVARGEGGPPTNDAAIYEYSGVTYDFYKDLFGRNSIDDNGMRLDSTVHYDRDYENAFWSGNHMVYGDGSDLFNRFTIDLSVVAHELTHGVIQYEAGLIYRGQSGALNESWADVLGSLVKQKRLNHDADQADWLVGEGLWNKSVKGKALRSLKAPGTAFDDPRIGKDIQPSHMRDYNNTTRDNGGVHINSGIPNHAFYLTALELGGKAWEVAGNIWYVTLMDKLSTNSNFQYAADATFEAAGELYGQDSKEQKAVYKGWEGVGLTPKKSSVIQRVTARA